jgi:hypothetical protein
MNAIACDSAILGKAQHNHGKIFLQGVQHGIELSADIAAKDRASFVEESRAASLLQLAGSGKDLGIGHIGWVEARICIQDLKE